MKVNVLAALSVLLGVLFVRTLSAADYYVATTGSDAADGLSAATPFKTIQRAINVAPDGSTIHVAEGTYEPIVTSNRVLTIIGNEGGGRATINGRDKNRCATLAANCGYSAMIDHTHLVRNTILRGFALVNGYVENGCGAGVFGGVVEDCEISGCRSVESKTSSNGYGGGAAACRLVRCLLTMNYARVGGGGYEVEAEDSTFDGNSTSWHYGGLQGQARRCRIQHNRAKYCGGGEGTFQCCVFWGNTSTFVGGYGGAATDSTLYFCTICDNRGDTGGVDECKVVGCIFYRNRTNGSKADEMLGRDITQCFGLEREAGVGNSMYPWWKTSGEDPRFVDPDNGDFRLLPDSPCIDLVSTNHANAIGTDLLGFPRISGPAPDCGACEYQVDRTLVTPAVIGHGSVSPPCEFVKIGGTNVFVASSSDRAFLGWTTNGTGIVSTNRTWVFRNDGSQGALTAHFATNLYYDAVNGLDTNDGATPETPRKSIQSSKLYSNEVVRLSAGFYSSIDATAASGLRVTGPEPDKGVAVVATIQADGTPKGQKDNVFSRLTVDPRGRGAYICTGVNGGIFRNCVIRNCSSTAYGRGGGASNATLVNCLIADCTSQYNGGGCLSCSLTNCVVTGCMAQRGGGCHSSTVRSSTLTRNAAPLGSEAYDSTLVNDIVWSPSSTQAVYNSTMKSCCTNDPKFVSVRWLDFRLRRGSPCLDAGADTFAAETDYWGQPRVQNGRIDIGALEGAVDGHVFETDILGYGTVDPPYAVAAEGTVAFRAVVGDRRFIGFLDGARGVLSPDETFVWDVSDGDRVVSACFETNLYVDVSRGNDAARGDDPAAPLFTISNALQNVHAGETIRVAPGIYDENLVLTGQVFTCVADEGPFRTVIDGGQRGPCIIGRSSAPTAGHFVGFTLTNGVYSSRYDRDKYPGGASYAWLSGCLVTGCRGRYGGGVYECTCHNCLICGNTAEASSDVCGGGAAYGTLVNCTVWGNTARYGYGGGVVLANTFNTIVCGNAAEKYPDVYSGTHQALCTNAPGVVSLAAGDMRLRTDSPCLDAGVEVDAGATDFLGRPRRQGAAIDIGAYEGAIDGVVVDVVRRGNGDNDAVGRYFISTETNVAVFTGMATNRIFLGFSTNGADIVSSDPTFAWLPAYGNGILTFFYETNLYVDASVAAEGDGLRRDTPWKSLSNAVVRVCAGETVHVAPGTYGPVTCPVGNYTLVTDGGPDVTFIDGEDRWPCVDCLAETTRVALCGFTVRRGRGKNEGWNESRGGGITYGTLCGCVIAGCTAEHYRRGTASHGATLESCLITDCSRTYGDHVASESRLVNCTVVGNMLTNSYDKTRSPLSFYGGSLTNCIVDTTEGAYGSVGTFFSSNVVFALKDIGDYRLRLGSPGVDASVPCTLRWPSDAAGRPRVSGAAPDVGAFEGAWDVRVMRASVSGHGTVSQPYAVIPPDGSLTVDAASTNRPFLGWSTNGSPIFATSPSLTLSHLPCDVQLKAYFATNHYVGVAGDDARSGFAPEDALKSVQAAAARALSDERICLLPGRFEPFEATDLSVPIVGAGIGLTVIDGGLTGRCVKLSASVKRSGTRLSHVTLANGRTSASTSSERSAYGGAGAYGGILSDCQITNCQANSAYGGGAYGATLSRCELVRNTGSFGGGVYDCRVSNSKLMRNSASSYYGSGGGAARSDLSGCLFVGNSAPSGGAAYVCNTLNCTIYSNSCTSAGAAYYDDENDSELCTHVRDILWQNTGRNGAVGRTVEQYLPDGLDRVEYEEFDERGRLIYAETNHIPRLLVGCCTATGEGLRGVKGDPLFVSAAHGDFRLAAGSPCIDCTADYGDIWSVCDEWSFSITRLALPSSDLLGRRRVQGASVDIGACEGETFGRECRLSAEGRGAVATDWVFAEANTPVTFEAVETVRPCLGWRIDDGPLVPAGPTWQTTLCLTGGLSHVVAVFSTNVYVNASRPDDTGDGLTRATAKRTLSAAEGVAFDDEVLRIAPGAYDSDGAKSKKLTYVGEGGYTNTLVRGDFNAEAIPVRVSGVTFAGSAVSGGVFAECLFDGGIVTNAALSRCTVWGDAADCALDRSIVWRDPKPATSGLRASDSYVGDPIFADPEEGDFRVAVDSPCASNGVAWCGVARETAAYPEAPTVTPGDGAVFSGTCTVSVSSESPKGKIWYSTTGRTPRLTDAFRYLDPFVVSNTVRIVVVQKVGRLSSPYAVITLTRVREDLRTGAGNGELVFTTSGDAEWEAVTEDGAAALRSGALGDGQSSVLASAVQGGGILSFDWKCDLEHDPAGACLWDRLCVTVDGVRRAAIDGATGWTNVAFRVRGRGTHAVRWIVEKDGYDAPDAACADFGWLRSVVWTASDPLPDPKDLMSDDEIADLLADFVDERLRRHVRDRARYARFRTWALGVCDRKGLDPEEIVGHPRSWLSFALDQPAFLAAEPADGSLKIDGCSFSDVLVLTLALDGLAIGDGAADADLREVFGLRGAASLGAGSAFAAESLEVLQAEPREGKASFTVRPKGTPASFFIKAEVLP